MLFSLEEMIAGDHSQSSSQLNTVCVKCSPQAALRGEEAGEVVTAPATADRFTESDLFQL